MLCDETKTQCDYHITDNHGNIFYLHCVLFYCRVSFYEMGLDGCERKKEKSSGLTVCTGTGSTSWFFNINHPHKQSVQEIVDSVLGLSFLFILWLINLPNKHNMFVQCWTNVEDVGPTLYKCYTNVLCLLGYTSLQKGDNSYQPKNAKI